MAILEKIRQRTWVLILIIGLALFAFIISDSLMKGGNNTTLPDSVATVNGKDIDVASFRRQVEAEEQRSNGSASTIDAVNRVWDRELRTVVVDAQLEELGITVEADQIWNEITKNQGILRDARFQDADGNFVENKLRDYISDLEATQNIDAQKAQQYQSWLAFERQIENIAKQKIYYNLVQSGSLATEKEGEWAYKMENDKVTFNFVKIPYTTIPDADAEVTKGEIKAYIAKHASQFEEEESRDIQYVKFTETPSLEDEEAIKKDISDLINGGGRVKEGIKNAKDIKSFVNNNSDDFKFDDTFYLKEELAADVADKLIALSEGEVYGPYKQGGYYKISKLIGTTQMADSVKSSHILVPFIGTASAGPDTKKTEEEAKKTVDSIFALVKNNKTKYAAIADEINPDGTKGKGGDIGWVAKRAAFSPNFDRDFADYMFSSKKGDIEVVKTKFGFHIIRIDDVKNTQNAVKLATVARKIVPSEKTLSDLFTTTTKFQVEATDKPGDFLDISKEKNYKVNPVIKMKAMDARILGLNNQRPIIRWAFNEETKVGDIKRFPVSDGYVVVQLSGSHAKGTASVEDASARVLPILKKQKKAQIIMSKNDATTLEALASANNVSVQPATSLSMNAPTLPGAGKEPKIVGAAFALKEGDTSKLLEGNTGVYMIQVNKITPAVAKESYITELNELRRTRAAKASASVFDALKDAAEIEDNRAVFY